MHNPSMGISGYIKLIGRGKDGARPLDRTQASDLMGQLLDGQVSDLEMGAFCIAMRIKGETPTELAGFLDAIHNRLPPIPPSTAPTVVLPSYNGARKLPVLTPLLGLLLARQGVRVLIHGQMHDPDRVTSYDVLRALQTDSRWPIDMPIQATRLGVSAGVHFLPTSLLLPGLQSLLDVRRVIGLRNSAHSLVKLMQPVSGGLLVSSYTHPEYLLSMGELLQLTGQHAMLLRGTEGEPVADPRRVPQMDVFQNGQRHTVQTAQTGTLKQLPNLPATHDATTTAHYIRSVLEGEQPVPASIALQVQHLCACLCT